ncbi:hypothetical protein CONPUDRAFT_166064 [Coniophora puteana RWD-64-598 SS2]|uniref:Uncharacterized protein n=1 Tax=Coniophora puteana (strain RWD-64-598) TaxID=741705 RepID=A0A5M3MPT1_CONPW|nr:uncharacterized protein CONPUDRAFT_166064 [Coniophora puteana RWD-64-598 SS2]EIW80571.1 hypothetical protein CONPUDRAFT_166064 [Coniophora puteana RWD-64-598 SS2]
MPLTRRQKRQQSASAQPDLTPTKPASIPAEAESVRSTDDADSVENDENAFVDNGLALKAIAQRRSLAGKLARTPQSARVSPALQDITDEFLYPPSPSLRRSTKRATQPVPHLPGTAKLPGRPHKPKSLAYPNDPPKWQQASSLPPSSPLPTTPEAPPNNNIAPHHSNHRSTFAHEWSIVPSSDPFGILAAERVFQAKRAAAPSMKPYSRPKPKQIPTPTPTPRSRLRHSVVREPSPVVPTNDEDFDDLYMDIPQHNDEDDEIDDSPIPPPIFVPSALDPSRATAADLPSKGTRDPLRTPHKRKHGKVINTGTPSSSDVPSSPSPVKLSRAPLADKTDAPVHGSEGGDDMTPMQIAKRVTRGSRKKPRTSNEDSLSPRQHVKKLEALLPQRPQRSTRRSTRLQEQEDYDATWDVLPTGKRKTRATSAAASKATLKATRKPQSRSTAKPASRAGTKGKGKVATVVNSDDSGDEDRDKHARETQARIEYFRKLEEYHIHEENVYVI